MSSTAKTNCKIFPDKPECLEFSDNRKTIICRDKKGKVEYKGVNSERKTLCKYKLDGCLIADNDKAKNDFLLINSDENKSYFIELKGSDLVKAVRQIDSGLTLLQSKFKGYAIHGRIVLTRVNTMDLRNNKYLKLKKRLERTGGNLKQKSQKMIEQL